jgi:hypothetical protein
MSSDLRLFLANFNYIPIMYCVCYSLEAWPLGHALGLHIASQPNGGSGGLVTVYKEVARPQ